MRIVAGRHRGQTLRAPRGRDTRPTSDRVREAVFSILATVEGDRVLDLFAGSGALAFEALSRGAASATLVDSDPAAIAAMQRNREALRVEAEIHRADALRFLQRARAAGRQYDLVFLDPPYRLAGALAPRLSSGLAPVLASGARVVTESDHRQPLELALPMQEERRYGQTMIRIHVT